MTLLSRLFSFRRHHRGVRIKPAPVRTVVRDAEDVESVRTGDASGATAMSRPLWVALGALIVAVVVVPSAYVPFALAASEWLRQTVMVVAALIGLVGVLIHSMRRKMIQVPRRWYVFGVFFALGLYGLITAFVSSTRYVSLYGYDGSEGYSAISFFALAGIAFIVVLLGVERRRIYYAWLIGSSVLVVGSLLSLYGVSVFWGTPGPYWTPVGSILALVLVAAVTIVGSYGLLTEYRPPRFMYAVAIVASIASMLLLVSVNNRYGFMVLAGGSLVFLVGAAMRKEEILSRAMMAPCIGLFVSLVYLLMTIPSVISTPLEVHVSLREGAHIAGAALIRNPVFGSGIGTFANEFLALRGANVVKAGFGNLYFHGTSSIVFTAMVTMGILGALGMLALLGLAFWRSGYGVIRDRRTGPFLAVQSVLVTLIGVVLLLPAHAVILFVLAVFIGLAASEGVYREVSMARSERGMAVRNIAAAALLLVLVFGTVIIVRRTGGVVFAVKATRIFAQNPALASTYMTQALTFDNGHDGYWRMMSDARRSQINAMRAEVGNTNPPPEVVTAMGQIAEYMVDAAVRSTVLAPGSSRNWASLGQAKLVSGVGNVRVLQEAKDAFERARTLNPHDPAIITALGVTERLIALANAGSEKPDNAKAIALLGEAITLQPAYIAAHLELARLHAASGEEDKARAAYGNARLVAPYDPRVAYEVALFLRSHNHTGDALAELDRALRLAPQFVDAHIAAAGIYANTGEYSQAITHLEAVQKMYPDNTEISAEIESLKAKAAAPAKKKK